MEKTQNKAMKKENRNDIDIVRNYLNGVRGSESELYSVMQKSTSESLSKHKIISFLMICLDVSLEAAEGHIVSLLWEKLTRKDLFKEFLSKEEGQFYGWCGYNAWRFAQNILSGAHRHPFYGYQEWMDSQLGYCETETDLCFFRSEQSGKMEYASVSTAFDLKKAVAALPKAQCHVVEEVLAPENEGLKHKELAVKLNISESAFNKRYFQAVKSLSNAA